MENNEFCIIYNSLSKELNSVFDDLLNNKSLRSEFSQYGVRVEKVENYVVIYTQSVGKGILNRVLKDCLKLRVSESSGSDTGIEDRLDRILN